VDRRKHPELGVMVAAYHLGRPGFTSTSTLYISGSPFATITRTVNFGSLNPKKFTKNVLTSTFQVSQLLQSKEFVQLAVLVIRRLQAVNEPTKNPTGRRGSNTQNYTKVVPSLTFLPCKVDSSIDLPWTQERSLIVDTWLIKRSRWEG
jgi:hypothetical protein